MKMKIILMLFLALAISGCGYQLYASFFGISPTVFGVEDSPGNSGSPGHSGDHGNHGHHGNNGNHRNPHE